jgi:periplasmic copper chaperone A
MAVGSPPVAASRRVWNNERPIGSLHPAMTTLSPGRIYWLGALCVGLLASSAAQGADLVEVHDPWARATVPGQTSGAVYMELVARENLRLITIRTAAAETAEVHQMKMEKGMMRMRALPHLDLPAGKPVQLEPGGYHIMLFDLKRSLVAGQTLKLELTLEDGAKRRHRVQVEAAVRDRDAGIR